MTRTIVVAATDPERSGPAAGLGVALARPLGAQVVLGAVAHRRTTLDQLTAHLAALAADVPRDVPVALDATTARSTVRGVHDLAERHGAILVVLPHDARGAIAHALEGDTASDVVFTAPCGVAVAPAAGTPGAPRHVGVAWDRSPEAGEALEWAVQLAERTGGRVELVHVLGADQGDDADRRAAEEELQRLCDAILPRAEAVFTLAWGDPGRLFAHLGERLDVLVLGSRRRSPVRRAVLGSVSRTAMRSASCAVVVLPRGVHAPADTAAV